MGCWDAWGGWGGAACGLGWVAGRCPWAGWAAGAWAGWAGCWGWGEVIPGWPVAPLGARGGAAGRFALPAFGGV